MIFEPIDTLNPLVILGWYGVAYLTAAFVAHTLTELYYKFKTIKVQSTSEFKLGPVLFAGIWEELTFRGGAVAIAYHTLELGPNGVLFSLLVANGVWAGMHKRKFGAFAFTFVLGLFFTKFWLEGFAGLWWMGIVMHMLHNLLVVMAGRHFGTIKPDPRAA